MAIVLLDLLQAKSLVVDLVFQWQYKRSVGLEGLLVDVRKSDLVAVYHILLGMLSEPAISEHVQYLDLQGEEVAWHWNVQALVPLELVVHDLAGAKLPGPQRELDEDLSLVREVDESPDLDEDFAPSISEMDFSRCGSE